MCVYTYHMYLSTLLSIYPKVDAFRNAQSKVELTECSGVKKNRLLTRVYILIV